MLLKWGLVSLTCLVIISCTSKADEKQSKPLRQSKSISNIQLLANDVTTKKRQQWQEFLELQDASAESSLPSPIESPLTRRDKLERLGSRDGISVPQANSLEPVRLNSYMTLTPTQTANTLGNPMYTLSLYANGRLLSTYPAVTGQASTQNKNRHQEGTEAPLPDGTYAVASSAIPGTDSEVGERFLPIQPLFPTSRSDLGIHFDQSFEKRNGEDGTHGCIALTDKRNLDQVLDYVRTYQPQYLEVNIQP